GAMDSREIERQLILAPPCDCRAATVVQRLQISSLYPPSGQRFTTPEIREKISSDSSFRWFKTAIILVSLGPSRLFREPLDSRGRSRCDRRRFFHPARGRFAG